jgi:hypothetical protein
LYEGARPDAHGSQFASEHGIHKRDRPGAFIGFQIGDGAKPALHIGMIVYNLDKIQTLQS